MNNFNYNIRTKVFFGNDSLENLGNEIKKYAKSVLIVYGSERIKTSGLFDRVKNQLEGVNISSVELGGIKPNPSLSKVYEGLNIIKENNIEFLLPVGGGSAIDAAKAMAVGAAMDIDPWEILKNQKPITASLPIGTVLTLAATGSEMNGNSVITNEETKEKLAFGTDLCRPVFSILDPTLTFTVPKNQTAAGVVDIFTHVAEQYFEPYEGAYLQDRMAEAVMETCIHYGPIVMEEPENYEARANIMWAGSVALNGILSYGKSGGDWGTHVMEHELSAAYGITHAVGLAILLPNWLRYVLSDTTVDRIAMFAKNVWGVEADDKFEQANLGIDATLNFFKSLGIETTLTEVGINDEKLDFMANQAVQFGEIGSFKKLNSTDVKNIYEMSL